MLQRPPFSTNVGPLDGDNLEKIRPDAFCEVRGLRRRSAPQSTDDRSVRRHSGSLALALSKPTPSHTASCLLIQRKSGDPGESSVLPYCCLIPTTKIDQRTRRGCMSYIDTSHSSARPADMSACNSVFPDWIDRLIGLR